MASIRETQDIRRFDRWSATYEDAWLQRHLFGPVHRAVLAIAVEDPAPAAVLDVGCGTGLLLRAVRAQWPTVQRIGVDPAEGMVAEARRLTPDATFFAASAETLPLPDASVDLALSTMSFHHWGDQVAGLREVARVLRPGGRFILADGTLPPWSLWLVRRLIRHPGLRSPKQVRTLFVAAGLAVDTQRSVQIARVVGRPVGICVTVGVRPADD